MLRPDSRAPSHRRGEGGHGLLHPSLHPGSAHMQGLGRGPRTQFPHQQGFVTFGGNRQRDQLRHPTNATQARLSSGCTAPAQGAPALFKKGLVRGAGPAQRGVGRGLFPDLSLAPPTLGGSLTLPPLPQPHHVKVVVFSAFVQVYF